MSSTNKTTNYNLSQFVGTDVPSYLGDYNSDMSKIDKAIGDVSNSQGSVEQSVVGLTAEVQGLSTQVDGMATSVQQLQTSVAQIDSGYKQADTALSQRITANANNIQTNTTAIENANTAIEGINTTIGTTDISGIGDGTIKGAISDINSSSMQIFSRKETVANNTISIESKESSSEVCSYTVTDDISCVVNFTASIDTNANGNRETIYILYRDGAEYSLYVDRCPALSENWGYLNSYTLPLKLKSGDKLAINCVQNSGSALSAVGVITFFK